MLRLNHLLVRHLTPWLLALAVCAFLAWSPVGLAQTPVPGSTPSAPMVDQSGLINTRNARVVQLTGLYDRGVQNATNQVANVQNGLVEQFGKVRQALDTARLQAGSGDPVQRANATLAMEQANRLLQASSARVQLLSTTLAQNTEQALNSGKTIVVAEQAQQRTIAGQALTPASSASIAAFEQAQQRLQALPSITAQLLKSLGSTIAIQQQDLRQRMALVSQQMAVTP